MYLPCLAVISFQELQDTLNPTLKQSSDLSIYQKKNFKTSWENKVVSPKLHQTLLFKFIESAVKSPSRSSNLFSAPIYQSTQQWVGTIIWFNIAAIYYFQKCWICWYKGQQKDTLVNRDMCIHHRAVFFLRFMWSISILVLHNKSLYHFDKKVKLVKYMFENGGKDGFKISWLLVFIF